MKRVHLPTAQERAQALSLLATVGRFKLVDNTRPSLEAICRAFEVGNISYIGMRMHQAAPRELRWQNTYAEKWHGQYQNANYIAIDPVVATGLTSALPFVWSDIPDITKQQNRFFGEADEFGIGNRGLSFPVFGRRGERGLVSMTGQMSSKSWRDLVREQQANLGLMANVIHQAMFADARPLKHYHGVELTAREKECLKWAAQGKTHQDIAIILKIAPRTVRFFLEGARFKLNCLNTTHTVAEAILSGIITF